MICRSCGRPLTNPVSLVRGYGPECDPDQAVRALLRRRRRRGEQIGPDLLELLIMDGEDPGHDHERERQAL